jgi:hypothetical protein
MMDAAGTTNRRKRQRASLEKDNQGPSLRKRSKNSFKEPPASQDLDEAQWWSVQTVLDERKRPGKPIEYKVLWDPHPLTGEIYPPSWEPAANLTKDLLVEWKQKSGKSGDQADGHVEPRSQAPYVPGTGADSSLDTGASTITTTPSRSAIRSQAEEARHEEVSASPVPSTAPSSPRRVAPPNQSQHLDPEFQESSQHTAESGEHLHSRRKSTTATVVEIKNSTDFPRDEYQGGLSQQPGFPAAQSEVGTLSSPLASVRKPATTTGSAQPSRQPADAATQRVIPDSQSQGNTAAIGRSSPTQSYFESPGLPQQVSSRTFGCHCRCRGCTRLSIQNTNAVSSVTDWE